MIFFSYIIEAGRDVSDVNLSFFLYDFLLSNIKIGDKVYQKYECRKIVLF